MDGATMPVLNAWFDVVKDILDQVFLNGSPPDTTTLHKANQVLNTALQAQTVLHTPTTR
jgi:hypothetical protein